MRGRLSAQPFGPARLATAMERVRSAIGEPATDVLERLSGALIPIAVESVSRFDAAGNYVTAYVENTRHVLHLSLNRLEEPGRESIRTCPPHTHCELGSRACIQARCAWQSGRGNGRWCASSGQPRARASSAQPRLMKIPKQAAPRAPRPMSVHSRRSPPTLAVRASDASVPEIR